MRKNNNPVPMFDNEKIEGELYTYVDEAATLNNGSALVLAILAVVYALVQIASGIFYLAKKFDERS